MGLLDEALGALEGGQFDNIVTQAAGAFGSGGLHDIVSKFQAGGLGDLAQSWIGTGANLPVSADQLQAVLGSDTVRHLAAQFGVDAGHLPALLPDIIDRLTPGGHIPGDLGSLIGGFLKT